MPVPDNLEVTDEVFHEYDLQARNTELYIEIQDGVPVNHPVAGGNLHDHLGVAFDVGDPPEGWANFTRRYPPDIDGISYKKVIESYVVLDDGSVTDDWSIVEMNDEERAARTVELEEEFDLIITSLTEMIDSTITRLTDENDTVGLALWQEFQTNVNTAAEQGFPTEIPKRPRKNADDTRWITQESEGEAPDVI